MILREIEKILLEKLNYQPVTALLGPRQVGKTTLVKQIQAKLPQSSVYFDLENSRDFQKFQTDAVTFLESMRNQTVILDEIQHLPALFGDLRGMIDNYRMPARFLLLGSASPALMKNTSESLAGRITYLEMPPLLFRELNQPDPTLHWLRGGFPNSFLAPTDAQQQNWFESFVTTYLQQDLPLLGLRANPVLLRRFLMMLASIQGNLLNQSTLANSLAIKNSLVSQFLDFFENAFLMRRLQPYFTNIGKRIVKTPKVYIRDSGLLHHLLNLHDYPTLIGHAVCGGSWEGYVIEQIVTLLPYQSLPFFYRTQDGAELDLVIETGLRISVAVEIKLSNTPILSKGNTVALQDVGNPPLLVITPSASDYQMKPNVWVCSVKTLPENLQRLGVF